MTEQTEHEPESGHQPPEQTDVQSQEEESLTPEDFDEDPSLNPDEDALKNIKGG